MTGSEWREGVSLSSDLSLIISNVIESDFGIFKCRQHELVDSDEATYKLYQGKMRKRYAASIYVEYNNLDSMYMYDNIHIKYT